MYNNNLAAPQRKFDTSNILEKADITYIHIRKACREYRYKNNRITQAICVILAFTGKKRFYFNQKSEVPLNNSKTSHGPC
jgi:hypothetical protein